MEEEDSFGPWLKRRRKQLDLTQQALAKQSGCTAETIRKLESGRRRPSKQLIRGLAEALQIPADMRPAFYQLARGHAGGASQLHAATAAPAGPSISPGTLPPAPLTPLVGRDAECAALREQLRQPGLRLLTLTGQPGVGKTRLALQLAAELRDAFADGVCFVALAPLRDAILVIPTIARALGVRELRSQPLLETLCDAIQGREQLLVLDNFEHVIAAAPDLAQLLERAPGITMLVTSRASLRITGEHIWVVEPLAFADPNGLLSPETLMEYPAAQLFVQYVQAARLSFELTEENAPAVAEICARLEGVPLALELAAARTKLLSPPQLLDWFDQRLTLLSEGAVNAPDRHQSLREAISWSYHLLAPDEQRLFRRLGVFAGGFSVEAATAVAAEPSAEERAASDDPSAAQLATLAKLAALIDQSLLRTSGTSEPRFNMLATIREYALEQLAAAQESDALRRRHAAFFLELAEAAAPQLSGPHQMSWLDRIEAEHANLRAALGYCIEAEDASREVGGWAGAGSAAQAPACDEMGLRLAIALCPFWDTRGYWREGRRWLEAVIERGAHADPALVALALAHASQFVRSLGDTLQAQELAERSLRLAKASEQPRSVAHALDALAACLSSAEAIPLYEEALALAQQMGDRQKICGLLYALGVMAKLQGDLAGAGERFAEALRLGRELGHVRMVVQALRGAGSVLRDLGDHERARARYEEALGVARELGFKTEIAGLLNHLGELERAEQNYTQAGIHYRQSLAIDRELGYKASASITLLNLGFVALHQDDAAQATADFTEALAAGQALGHRRIIVGALMGLGAVAQAQGQAEPAARLLGAADTLREAVGFQFEAVDQATYDRTLAAVRAQLDEATFDAAWEAGRALTLDDAIATATEVAEAVRSALEAQSASAGPSYPADLTAREVEVLRLVAQGLTNPQIAERLIISPRTVHAHLRAIYGKLGVTNRSAATRFALEQGLA